MNQKTQPTKEVEFLVEDFGPITRAELDLRPLTVFVGPNNTGKSYLATLIHTLFVQCLHNLGFVRVSHSARGNEIGHLSDAERGAFVKWLENYEEIDPKRPVDIPTLPGIVDRATQKLFSKMHSHGEGIDDLLARYFWAEDIQGLVRTGAASPARVSISIPESSARTTISIDPDTGAVSVHGEIPSSHTFTPTQTLDWLLPSELYNVSRKANNERWQRLSYGKIIEHVFSHTFWCLTHASHYFPADRTGIMNLYRSLFWGPIERATGAGRDLFSDAPNLSGVHGDLLRKMLAPQKVGGCCSAVAKALEDDILGGAIFEERSGESDFPAFFYQSRGARGEGKVPLRNASSAVSELAPIVVLLRKMGTPGNLLIIEEPEIHLRPGAQAKLAVQLARLVDSGIRVLVTTHSQWILEQFANLVGASTLNGDARTRFEDRHPYLAGVRIPSEKIGVWLFSSKEGSGSTVSEIKLDPESGVFPAQFDTVSMNIYSEWAEIYNEFQEAQGEGDR